MNEIISLVCKSAAGRNGVEHELTRSIVHQRKTLRLKEGAAEVVYEKVRYLNLQTSQSEQASGALLIVSRTVILVVLMTRLGNIS